MAAAIGLLTALVISGLVGSTNSARHPTFFGGRIVLADTHPLIGLDIASGAVEVRLTGVNSDVGATTFSQVQPVNLDSGTLLVNRVSGNFNMLGNDNFVVDPRSDGIRLPHTAGATGAEGVADGDAAFVVHFAPASTVSLIEPSTVATAAASNSDQVPVRGYATLNGSVPNRPGATVAANGSLYTVVQVRGSNRLERLSLAAGSALSTQTLANLGSTSTPAAVESVAPAEGAAQKAASVAVATPGTVRWYPPAGRPLTVPVPATARASAIESVSGASGEAWFVARAGQTWSVFGVSAQGQITGPSPLVGVPGADNLAQPAFSEGSLYTMAQTSAATGGGASAPVANQPPLWVVDPSNGGVHPLPGYPTYPLDNPSERADFSAAQVVTKGPRVVFDNPDSVLGVVVFTDGSHPPSVFDKNNGVAVAGGGAGVLAAPSGAQPPSRTQTPGAAAAPTTTIAPSAPAVNPTANCTNTSQTPRTPQIYQVVPSVRSAQVRWTYPLLEEQDCAPTSWAIQVRALNAPQPSQPIQTEQGQQSYQFTGLRPAVQYQVTVTAYLTSHFTTSAATTFTTLPTGSDPPTSVHTASDGHGDWVVSWQPCTASTCYVPATTWVVTGSSCGSYAARPPSTTVSGSQTSVTIPAAPGGLLGDSFSFQVQGVSAAGLTGDPTSDHACTEAWQPPNPAAFKLSDAAVAQGNTITGTLQLAISGTPSVAIGSKAANFTYHVGSVTVGPTTATTVKVTGLVPGASYTPSVTVTPVAHPGAAISLAGPPIHQTLSWPANLAVSVQASVEPNANQGNLVATFSPALPVPVEVSGSVTCGGGGSSFPIPSQQLNGNRAIIPMDLANFGGSCMLSATLGETSTSEFGVASPPVSTSFTIGAPVNTSSFRATWGRYTLVPPDFHAVISGSPAPPTAGVNWNIAVTAPAACTGTPAISSPGGPPSLPIDVDLGACPLQGGQFQAPVFTITYHYLGEDQSFTLVTGGTPPTTTTTQPSTTTTTQPSTTTTQPSTTTTQPSTTTTTPCSSTSTSGSTSSSTDCSSTTTTTAAGAAAAAAVSGGATPASLTAQRGLGPPASDGGTVTFEAFGGAAVAVGGLSMVLARRSRRRPGSPSRKKER